MQRHTLSLLIVLLATLLFPWNSGTEVQSIPIPIVSYTYILSARTTQRKHSLYTVAWRRPHRKHMSRVRLRVHWPVTSTGRGAGDKENTASFIVACWTVFTELLSGNALIWLSLGKGEYCMKISTSKSRAIVWVYTSSPHLPVYKQNNSAWQARGNHWLAL
jgi:hypothetical protein